MKPGAVQGASGDQLVGVLVSVGWVQSVQGAGVGAGASPADPGSAPSGRWAAGAGPGGVGECRVVTRWSVARGAGGAPAGGAEAPPVEGSGPGGGGMAAGGGVVASGVGMFAGVGVPARVVGAAALVGTGTGAWTPAAGGGTDLLAVWETSNGTATAVPAASVRQPAITSGRGRSDQARRRRSCVHA